MLKHVAPSFWLALLATLAVATAAGFLGGLVAIRARGVYFALITFGMAQVVSKVVFNTRELGASDGLIGIPVLESPPARQGGRRQRAAFFLLVLTLIMGAYFGVLAYLIGDAVRAPLAAIRANEHRVPFLGFEPMALQARGLRPRRERRRPRRRAVSDAARLRLARS